MRRRFSSIPPLAIVALSRPSRSTEPPCKLYVNSAVSHYNASRRIATTRVRRVLTLFRLLGRLPLPVLHTLGALAGWIAYLASPTYRRRIHENLAAAGITDARVRRSAVAHAGRQALETAWVWMRPAQALRDAVQVENPQALEALLARPGPLVLLTPHLGCFEIIAQYWMLDPRTSVRPMTALYRVPRKAQLKPLLQQARLRHGLRLAPAELRGVRLLLRALKEGGVAGILPDQVPSQGEGVWAPFFGRPAYTMTLPGRLAASTGATVAFVHAERLPGGRGFRLCWTPLDQPTVGDAAADAATLNRALEALIRRLPEQYLWGYNRYKVPAGVPGPDLKAPDSHAPDSQAPDSQAPDARTHAGTADARAAA